MTGRAYRNRRKNFRRRQRAAELRKAEALLKKYKERHA